MADEPVTPARLVAIANGKMLAWALSTIQLLIFASIAWAGTLLVELKANNAAQGVRIALLSEKLTDLEKAVSDRSARRSDTVDNRFDKLDSRLDRIEERIEKKR